MARAPLGRQQLLDAARVEMVAGRGSIDLGSVVRRAELTTGALYHHFSSKAGLLAAIYDDFYEALDRAIADVHLPAGGDWATRERERTRRMVEYHYNDPLAEMLLNSAASDPRLSELEARYVRRMGVAAAANIRRGQSLGQLSDTIDPDSAGAFVMGGLRLGMAQQLGLDPRPPLDRAVDHLWRLVAAVLGCADD